MSETPQAESAVPGEGLIAWTHVIYGLLFATLIGAVLAIPMFLAVGVWVIYRVVRGWLALTDGKPL